MRKEIKELYLQTLKYQRTIQDLKERNKEVFDIEVGIGPYGFNDGSFSIAKAHQQLINFLYSNAKGSWR